MRNATIVLFASSLLAACGADIVGSCQDYYDAEIACIEEAYADDQATLDATLAAYPDTYCDAYADVKGDAAKAAADLFDCYAASVEAADCSTPEGYATHGTELLGCVGG